MEKENRVFQREKKLTIIIDTVYCRCYWCWCFHWYIWIFFVVSDLARNCVSSFNLAFLISLKWIDSKCSPGNGRLYISSANNRAIQWHCWQIYLLSLSNYFILHLNWVKWQMNRCVSSLSFWIKSPCVWAEAFLRWQICHSGLFISGECVAFLLRHLHLLKHTNVCTEDIFFRFNSVVVSSSEGIKKILNHSLQRLLLSQKNWRPKKRRKKKWNVTPPFLG